MPMPFPHYAQIKDNYCCCYLGNSPEYVVALQLLKPQIEKQLPGLKVWIGCRDEFKYLLTNESQVIFLSEIEKRKKEFAYIREIHNSASTHSVLDLMLQSELKIETSTKKDGSDLNISKICLVCPEGIEPVKSITESSAKTLASMVIKSGYTPIMVGSDIHKTLEFIDLRPDGGEKLKYIELAGWIIGVENEYLFLGASKGIKTTLIKSGIGASLFKQLFPHANIVDSVQSCDKFLS